MTSERFDALCRERRLNVIDTIERQLADLALVRLPSAKRSAERGRFVEQAMASKGAPASYGTWVYFPWEAKVIHLLDADDYFEVITNRNQDKITRAEQRELRTKRVGGVGLSVGGEAAVTLAQEHLCGEIVLADFDRLDLSNLNRLGAGCDELGLPKTTYSKGIYVSPRLVAEYMNKPSYIGRRDVAAIIRDTREMLDTERGN